MNVVQPVPVETPRVALLAVGGARGCAWIAELGTGTVIAASEAATACLAGAATRLDERNQNLEHLFGRDAARLLIAAGRNGASGHRQQLKLKLDGVVSRDAAHVTCRPFNLGGQHTSDTGSVSFIWIEFLDQAADAAQDNRISFGRRQDTRAGPTQQARDRAEAGASPLSRLQRQAIAPADQATLNDIAARIEAAKSDRQLPASADGTGVRGVRDLALLAHELRTPIGAITTLTQILRAQCKPEATHYLDDIEMCANHALDVVAAALSETSPNSDAGNMQTPATNGSGAPDFGPLQLADTDLAALSGAVSKAMGPAAHARKVRVACYAEVGFGSVMTDPRAVRQILFNLMSNAIKYTDAGGEVTVFVETDARGHPTLVVRDTGHGMTAEDLTRARSMSADGTQARYGLRIVQALAERLGAALAIDSKSGVGTRVTVTLPRREPIGGSTFGKSA